MTQLRRLFEIDRLIRAGRAPSPGELADILEVSRRQIFEDVRHMKEEWQAPIKSDRRKGGWVYTSPTWVMPTVLLEEGELLAFFLSAEIARSSANPGIEEPLQSAVDKIRKSLGDLVSVDLNLLGSAMTFSLSPAARVNSQVALQLARAQAGRRQVRIEYYTASRDSKSSRVVHPYRLFLARSEWLLLAWDENRREVRSFNIARIQTLQVLPNRFEIDPNFDMETLRRTMLWAEAGQKVFEVALKFDEYQARYMRERSWHPDEVLEELDGGGLVLRFPASGLAEVCRFAMGFGAHVEVLEPMELRVMVREQLEGMLGIYGEEGS